MVLREEGYCITKNHPYGWFFSLPQQEIEHQHHGKAKKERIGRAALASVGMGLGDHLVADDVEHRAACKGKREGEDRRGEADRKVADQRSQDLHQSRCHRNEEGPPARNACRDHGRNDDHALGNVLQSNAACHGDRLSDIAASEAHPRRDPLGQIVDADGNDEQKHLVEPTASLGMRLAVHTRELMQVRDETVDEVEADRSAKDADDREGDRADAVSVFEGRQDQADHGGREHHAGRKGQNDIVDSMGGLFEQKSQCRANHGGAAHSQGRENDCFHCFSPFSNRIG